MAWAGIRLDTIYRETAARVPQAANPGVPPSVLTSSDVQA